MRRLLTILLCLCFVAAFAQPGKVLVKGYDQKVYVYNSNRPHTWFAYDQENTGEQEIQIPEEQCRDLLYLIAGETKTWIRLQPGETVEATLENGRFNFTGDEADINNYLFDWTQKMYFTKQNMLIFDIQNMMSFISQSQRGMPDLHEFYTPEYMAWVAGLKDELDKDLKKAKLKDKAFVAEQQQRIKFVWWELQFANFRLASYNVPDIPAEAFEFIKDVKLNEPGFLDYPGCDAIQKQYIAMSEHCGLLKYDTYADYLRARAEVLQVPEIMENYVLNELFLIFKMRGYYYQGDKLMDSVKDMIVTEEGKKRFAECRALYEKEMETDMEGKKVADYAFETYQGDSLRLSQFLGKYLFIDVWATWCAPCKAQIPYLKKLEEKLEGLPIQFLSLSADAQKSKPMWKELVKTFGLENGNCAITPDAFNHPMMQEFKIDAIPHFILIDPEGKVVMSSARLPSDPLLEFQLRELMD